MLEGALIIRCRRCGSWSSAVPICVVSARNPIPTCNTLDAPHHGFKTGQCFEGAPAGATCSFSCNSGFMLNGHPRLVCQVDGTWNHDPPSCIQHNSNTNTQITCPGLAPPDYGFYEGTCSPVGINGQSCVFSCNAGYALVGFKVLTCAATGQWSRAVPYCRKVACYPSCSRYN
ncbi:P-selectin-like protein [Dinothrombium tinctorium]|uniref:P-selectin-like protein n=1 Tax=Dinothrombium tinctorium TaxID=1965070 RepID=A0A3S3QLG9_9ACAR|nr:P-selectin-like protein [Dinothrombium tinctorium]